MVLLKLSAGPVLKIISTVMLSIPGIHCKCSSLCTHYANMPITPIMPLHVVKHYQICWSVPLASLCEASLIRLQNQCRCPITHWSSGLLPRLQCWGRLCHHRVTYTPLI